MQLSRVKRGFSHTVGKKCRLPPPNQDKAAIHLFLTHKNQLFFIKNNAARGLA
jgi:hypothetical protein